MSEQKKAGSAQKLVPIGAPVFGAVVMVAFIALAFTMGKIDGAAITTKADQVTQTLTDTKVVIPSPESQKFNVKVAEPAKRAEFPALIANQDAPLNFPLRFRITLDQPNAPEKSAFELLDTNNDKTLSLQEFLKGAGNTQADFELKDKDKNKKLTQQEYDWKPDGPPPPKTEFDLAPPANVKAVLDYVNPKVTITWDPPTLTDKPDDLGYLVYRAGPKHFLKRNTDYREGPLKKFLEDEKVYEAAYREWAKIPANAGKSRKQYEEETKNPPPVKPPNPAEWELLTSGPLTDVTYEDTGFELDSAFVYAVRATTAQKVKTGAKLDPKEKLAGYSVSEGAAQGGHPVYFANRTSVSFVDVTDVLLTVYLTRWHRVGGNWRQVRAKFSAEPQSYLGRKIKVSELKEKDADDKYTKYDPQVLAEDGNPNEALLGSLDAGEEINFESGWRFEARNAPNDPQISNKAGDVFLLPKATRDAPAAPVAPGAMANPVEIRVVGVKPDNTLRFEFTRWHQAGKVWYRVVIQQEVKRDGAIGVKGKIADLAKDAKWGVVYDMNDNKAGSLAGIAPQDVSLETGVKFVKLTGRVVDLGDNRTLDVYGVQFAE
ncbi:MAG: hypothetical protein IT462_10920 [Planctomycetes bacterium]|nr:hypothetical protein [Planctomycetota bacterium]